MADNPTFVYAAPYDRANDADVDYKPTRHGAWTGIGVGAMVGTLFPSSTIAGAVLGGTAGGVIGQLRKGMSRGELKDDFPSPAAPGSRLGSHHPIGRAGRSGQRRVRHPVARRAPEGGRS